MYKRHLKNTKKKSSKKRIWHRILKEVGFCVVVVLMSFTYHTFDDPVKVRKLKNILKYSIDYVRYSMEVRKWGKEEEKWRGEKEKWRKVTREKRIKYWNKEKIGYPVRAEFIELPIIATDRVVAANSYGFDSDEYKKALEKGDLIYHRSLEKIPKQDPVWVSLWMAYEYSFLWRLKIPIPEEQIKEAENIIEVLLNAKKSKSRRFIIATRFDYISKLMCFLAQYCQKSFAKCNIDFLYKTAKEFIEDIYRFDRNNVNKTEEKLTSFLEVYMSLGNIYLAKYDLLPKDSIERLEIDNLIYNLIMCTDEHVKLLRNNQELVNQYQKFKKNALTRCNL